MPRLTQIDDLYPGDVILVVFRWPLMDRDETLSGFVVGTDDASVIHRDGEPHLVIEVPGRKGPYRYRLPLFMIRRLHQMGKSPEHRRAMSDCDELLYPASDRDHHSRANG